MSEPRWTGYVELRVECIISRHVRPIDACETRHDAELFVRNWLPGVVENALSWRLQHVGEVFDVRITDHAAEFRTD